MNAPSHLITGKNQDQPSFNIFQPTYFNSAFEPDSLEDFDFESAPMTTRTMTTNTTNTTMTMNQPYDEDPQSSSVTSIVTSSTVPILKNRQQPIPARPATTATITTETTDTTHVEEFDMSVIEDSPKPTPTPPTLIKRNMRNYQLFPGRTKFLCHGRLVTSKDYVIFMVGNALFLVPSALYGYFVCPFLWENLHPAIPVVFIYLFILCFISLLKTSWTDPGIIPRNLDPNPEVEDDTASELYATSDWQDTPPKEILIKDTRWSLKYCNTCKIYRPPRASHCRQCDNCVEFEDHHCIWLNNCIGKRNYRSFFTFILSAALICVFVVATSVYQLLYIHHSTTPPANFVYIFNHAPFAFVLCLYCFVLLWMVGGLTLYHCSLIFRGVTTHEQVRAEIMQLQYPSLGANPYNKHSPLKNMIQVLCQPQPKSYLRRRKMADPIISQS